MTAHEADQSRLPPLALSVRGWLGFQGEKRPCLQVFHHDCSHVFVVNGTLPNYLLPDGLHPSDEGEILPQLLRLFHRRSTLATWDASAYTVCLACRQAICLVRFGQHALSTMHPWRRCRIRTAVPHVGAWCWSCGIWLSQHAYYNTLRCMAMLPHGDRSRRLCTLCELQAFVPAGRDQWAKCLADRVMDFMEQ